MFSENRAKTQQIKTIPASDELAGERGVWSKNGKEIRNRIQEKGVPSGTSLPPKPQAWISSALKTMTDCPGLLGVVKPMEPGICFVLVALLYMPSESRDYGVFLVPFAAMAVYGILEANTDSL